MCGLYIFEILLVCILSEPFLDYEFYLYILFVCARGTYELTYASWESLPSVCARGHL